MTSIGIKRAALIAILAAITFVEDFERRTSRRAKALRIQGCGDVVLNLTALGGAP